MTRSLRERPEFKRGRDGEQKVAEWLQERGWYVVPSYDYSGENGDKAPRLMGLRDAFPVPDLDVCRDGDRKWVEVKTKTEASWTIKTQRYEHGMEHRLYQAYVRVSQESGTPCWIAIYETSTGSLLCQALDLLGAPRVSTMNGRRMAYWPRDSFELLHTFDPVDLGD